MDAASRLKSLYVEPESPPRDAEPPVLELIDVFKIFGSGPTETVALRGLDLTVAAREMVAVAGPSGSGKSTMLSIAAAMDVPSAGDVRLEPGGARWVRHVELQPAQDSRKTCAPANGYHLHYSPLRLFSASGPLSDAILYDAGWT